MKNTKIVSIESTKELQEVKNHFALDVNNEVIAFIGIMEPINNNEVYSRFINSIASGILFSMSYDLYRSMLDKKELDVLKLTTLKVKEFVKTLNIDDFTTLGKIQSDLLIHIDNITKEDKVEEIKEDLILTKVKRTEKK